jgi:peptidoglycan/xylan/chitin deacetylase (PgdA/CDA1 family)
MKKPRHERSGTDNNYRYPILLLAAALIIAVAVFILPVFGLLPAGGKVVAGKRYTDIPSPVITSFLSLLPSLSPSFSPSPAPSLSPTPQVSAKALKPDSAVVIFTFDDGSESDYLLAYPILKKYAIKGTSYLITKFTDENATGKMTWTQIKEMSAYGWVFGCHTYDHRHLASMTDEEIGTSMEMVNQSFMRQGFQPPDIMAYPYGSYSQRVIDDIKPYRKQARQAFYNTDFVDLKNVKPYEIPCVNGDMRTTKQLNSLERVVEKACKEKAVVVFRFHCLYKQEPYDTVKINHKILSGSAAQTSASLLEELVEYCVDKGCAFMTMTQLMDLYS